MATTVSAALFLSLNLLFFTTVSSCGTCPNPPIPNPPTPSIPTPSGAKCPRNVVKLGVCADTLGLINLNLGKAPKVPCCALLNGLVNLEAALCLCTALKANILGINLNIPINLSLLLNYCGQTVPPGFQCP